MEPPFDAVHIWKSSLIIADDEYQAFWRILDLAERTRAVQFRARLQQRRFVACRAQLRCLLARYLRMSPTAIQFTRGTHGKPRLSDTEPDQGLVFNVSDSGDHALYALAYNRMLGVDLQIWRGLNNLDGLVERCFAAPEKAYWQSVPDSERRALFFSFWTLKEAFVKAIGIGIPFGLSRCMVRPGENPRLLAIPMCCGAANDWMLKNLELGTGLSGALAVKPRTPRIVFRELASACLSGR